MDPTSPQEAGRDVGPGAAPWAAECPGKRAVAPGSGLAMAASRAAQNSSASSCAHRPWYHETVLGPQSDAPCWAWLLSPSLYGAKVGCQAELGVPRRTRPRDGEGLGWGHLDQHVVQDWAGDAQHTEGPGRGCPTQTRGDRFEDAGASEGLDQERPAPTGNAGDQQMMPGAVPN